MTDDSRHGVHVDWERRDHIPVLTDIVDPADFEDAGEPVVVIEDEHSTAAAALASDLVYDDNFGVDEAEAAGLSAWAAPAAAPIAREAALDDLRRTLTAELHHAAERIVEESVTGVETELAARIAGRLKDEVRGIVGATLAEFERQDHNDA
jgi:hypothetical protein